MKARLSGQSMKSMDLTMSTTCFLRSFSYLLPYLPLSPLVKCIGLGNGAVFHPCAPAPKIETNEYIVGCGNTQRGMFKHIQHSFHFDGPKILLLFSVCLFVFV